MMQVFTGIALLAAGGKLPHQLAIRGVESVETSIVALEEHFTRGYCGRRCYPALGFEFPAQRAGSEIERVKIAVGAADVDDVTNDSW
jgi:hypothetical protein